MSTAIVPPGLAAGFSPADARTELVPCYFVRAPQLDASPVHGAAIFDPEQLCELWDPATGTWTTMASLAVVRTYHSIALLLPDGRVLSAGGEIGGASAEIYSPPYLFHGSRPTITSAPTSVRYGQSFFVGTLGSILGVVLGLVLSRNIFVTNFFEQFHTGLTFSIPWQELGLIVGIALLASFLGALLPAWQAGRISPAEAIRYV